MLEYLRACAGNNEATKPVYCHHLPVIRSQYSTKYQPIMRPDSVIVSCACFFCILIVSLFCNHHHHHNEEDQNRGKMKWDRMIVESVARVRLVSSFLMYCIFFVLHLSEEWWALIWKWGKGKIDRSVQLPLPSMMQWWVEGENQFLSF